MRVPTDAAGMRLDVWLGRQLGVGRRAARRLAEVARINGRPAAKGVRVSGDDEIELPPAGSADLLARLDLAQSETPDLLVLEKPSGLPTTALPGRAGASLAAWLALRHPECAALGGPGECGLVHRLDTDTSGLILAARKVSAFEHLRAQFRRHEVEKTYLAVVSGRVEGPLVLDLPIGQHEKSRRRMRIVPAPPAGERYAAQPACSLVEPLHQVENATLVRVTTRTGVRHQVRVHLASAGHPLLGDALYGGPAGPGLAGHLLHASRLVWRNPDGTVTEASSALPGSWRAALGPDGYRAQDTVVPRIRGD